MAWLDMESANAVAVTSLAEREGWHGPAWQLPRSMWRYFLIRGHYHDWIGRSGPAIDHQLRALALYRELDDQWGVSRVLAGLGNIHRLTGSWEQARDHFHRGLDIAGPTGDHWGSCLGHTGLSQCTETGAEGVEHGHRALTLATAIGDHWIEGIAHAALSFCHSRLGAADQAHSHATRALELSHRLGDRWMESQATIALATVARLRGDHGQAASRYARALRIATRIGALGVRASTHNDLGDLHLETGDAAAVTHHHRRQALALAEETANDRERRRANAHPLSVHSGRPQWTSTVTGASPPATRPRCRRRPRRRWPRRRRRAPARNW